MTLRIDKYQAVRERAERDLLFFIRLIHPNRMIGLVHEDLINWWTRDDAKSHQLVLLPRDHQKSAMVAYRVAWELTRDPTLRVLYISSTSGLATKQLKFIKDILTCDAYRLYWPEMVNVEESKREKWTETEISIDHPLRKQEFVRDPSIFTAGLTTNIVGLHCDIAVLDDIVVSKNVYTEDGRTKTRDQVSALSSIAGTDAKQWVVGTRYHPRDIYDDFVKMQYDTYDLDGNILTTEYLYEVYEKQVEDRGDGTGQFIWPRQQRYDGKWFGFSADILSKKRAQYEDKTQFRAQYYNNPNDADSASIKRDMFQYYDKKHLHQQDGYWYLKGNRLNIFAAIDFAYSTKAKADYSCIAVVGVDTFRNYYILDIVRFKSSMISDYYQHILTAHVKWGFRKIRAEMSAAQEVIVKDIKANYIKPNGLALVVEEHRPVRGDGTKEERIEAVLQPKYSNGQIWHYMSGECQTLEEELVLQRPPHDDVKDAVANAIEVSIPPTRAVYSSPSTNKRESVASKLAHSRFGGIS